MMMSVSEQASSNICWMPFHRMVEALMPSLELLRVRHVTVVGGSRES